MDHIQNRKILTSPEAEFPPSSQKLVFLFFPNPPPPLTSITTTVESSSAPLPLFLTCAVVFVIALICISFVVVFVLLPFFDLDRSIIIGPGSEPSIESGENGDRGVDPSLIQSLPVFEFELGGKGSVNCAICLCEFEPRDVVKKIPFCGHVFHPKCIEMWLFNHPSCPLCRSAKLFPQPVQTFNGLALLRWLKLI